MCRVPRIAGAHVDDPQPVGVSRLEVVQLVAEHRAVSVPVAVDQGEATFGLDGKCRLQDREHWGDAAAGGNRHVVLPGEWVERCAERTGRCHQIEGVAGPELLHREGGEGPARDVLDGDRQHVGGGRGADGVVAPDALASEVGADADVLAGLEGELVAQVVGNLEADQHAVIGQPVDAGDRDRVEHRGMGGGSLRHPHREEPGQLAVQPLPLAVLIGVELLAEDGADRSITLEIGLLVALPGCDVAVERDRGVQVVDEVVVLREKQGCEDPFRADAVAGGAVAVLLLGVLEVVVRQPVEPPRQDEHGDPLGDQEQQRQRPQVSGERSR